ncbi:MAG: branched-chain amino acid ABC transporter permease [Chloroflexota bacterium]
MNGSVDLTQHPPGAPAKGGGFLRLSRDRTLLEMAVMVLVFLALWPVLGQHRVTDFMIFCILVLSFDLLYGYMGRLSFGHVLYYGIGAYASSAFIVYVTPNPLLGALVGVLTAIPVAMLIGLIVSRADGAPFALTNLAFNQVGLFLAISGLQQWTLGDNGLPSTIMQPVGFLDFTQKPVNFWFAMFWLLVVFYFLKRLTRSPYGILVRSIKEDESRVRFLGYNTFYYKWLTYVIACSLAALPGVLHTLNYTFVAPQSIDPNGNVEIIFASLLGGAGNLYGAIVGGVIYRLITNFLPIWVTDWEVFLGVVLLSMVFFFRKGVVGYVTTWWSGHQEEALEPRTRGGEAL